MRASLLRGAAGCTFALLLGAPVLRAQVTTGSITGSVTDASGAVIANAHVVAHDLDTGVDTFATTNASGAYNMQFLPIGHYQVMVDAAGFDKATIEPFSLEVLQTASFNIKLKVGNSSETVNVSAAAPILNTNDPTLGTTFTANQIANTPLNGLDFSALTLYTPGTVDTAGTSGTTSIERSQNYVDTPNMNGNRAQANNYTLDGIDMNETFNNLISYSPAPEALAEIHVLTANSPAEYGNVNGGGVASVLKSGTNAYHGSAYGYVQDYRFNANSWTNKNHAVIQPISPFSQSQFGGTFGGPILHDKLFFFVDYLGARYHRGGSASPASVLTAAMRQGDFSALLTAPNPIQLYDPENNYAPYVGNKNVPILNPVAKYLFAHPDLYPLPNAVPTDGVVSGNLTGNSRNYTANNQGDIKIEYDPRAQDKVTGFFSISTSYDGSTALLPITFPGINIFPTKLTGLNWVHTFSPSIINSARVGFTRTTWQNGLPSDPTGLFGLKGDSIVGIPGVTQNYVGFSSQNISGLSSVGTPAQGGGLIDNTFSYIDTVTWQKNKHLLSFGIQALRYQNNYPTANNYGFLGSLTYSGAFTSNPLATTANGGYGAADFVLDRVAAADATLGFVNVGNRQWRTAGYATDDYKLLPNLTLNFGVRYEFDEPWVEQNNKTGNVDLATGQVQYAHAVPAGAAAGSGVCSNRACYDPNFTQIMPRVGFAYQVNDRFVVRGGYGATSFFEGNAANQRLTSITPFIEAVQISTLTPTTTNPGASRTAEQGFTHTAASLSLSGTYNVYPKNIQPAYVQMYNLTTEYALTRSTSLQVGYLGEQGQHIEDYGNVNQLKVNGVANSAPYANVPAFGTGSLLITESRAMMNFNALESTLRQRASHGLEFTLNYTYAKAMTNSLGNYGLQVNGYSGAFQNYYDSAADYGPAGYDIRHNITGTGVYALPVGHGQEYFSDMNRFVDEAVGGWKLSVAAVSYSGFPETLTYNGGNNSNSYGTARPNQYRKLNLSGRNINQYFGDASKNFCQDPGVDNGTCAFGVPANNTFGTSRNGAVRGPGFLNVDTSAFKDFRIIREQSVGFRFDAFNVFNIASYGNPDNNINDTTVGDIANQGTPVRSTERRLQFSARYTF